MRNTSPQRIVLLPAAVALGLLLGCGGNQADPPSADSSPQGEPARTETGEFQQLTLADFTPFAPTAGAAESWLAEDETLNTTGQPLEAQLELEAQGLARMAGTADAREGLKAFAEKRKPNFKGR